MHRATLTIIITTIPVRLLAATVAISVIVSEDAFARNERYGGSDTTSQAVAVDNDCLNPILDSNTIDNVIGVANCGGTVSQQDESGQASAPITHQTANPTIELQRATTSQPPDTGEPPQTCEECFDILTDAQKMEFEAVLSSTSMLSPPFPSGITTIEELCEAWKEFTPEQREFEGVVSDLLGVSIDADIPSATWNSIMSCLFDSVG